MTFFQRIKTPFTESPADEQTRLQPRMRLVGELLQERREDLGLDLDEIGAMLRIKPAYLAALEQGRTHDLPGPTYAIGFVRAYAEFLGLEAEPVLSRFKAEAAGVTARPDLALPVPLGERSLPGGALVLVALIMALCGYGIWYYLSTEERNRPERVAAVPAALRPPPAEPVLVTPPSAAPTASTADNNAPQPAQAPLGAAADPTQNPAPPSSPPAATAAPVPAAAPAPAATAVPLPAVPPPATAPATSSSVQTAATQKPAPAATLSQGALITSMPRTGAPPAASAPATPIQATPLPPPAPAAAAPPQPQATQTAAAPTPAAAPATASANGPPAARVAIRAVADCWIQVRAADQSIVFSRVLKAGEVYNVPARPGLSLRTGNAGALEVSVDGKTAPSIGSIGTLRRDVVLDPAELAAGTAVHG